MLHCNGLRLFFVRKGARSEVAKSFADARINCGKIDIALHAFNPLRMVRVRNYGEDCLENEKGWAGLSYVALHANSNFCTILLSENGLKWYRKEGFF